MCFAELPDKRPGVPVFGERYVNPKSHKAVAVSHSRWVNLAH
jgi:hypothetical protein